MFICIHWHKCVYERAKTYLFVFKLQQGRSFCIQTHSKYANENIAYNCIIVKIKNYNRNNDQH